MLNFQLIRLSKYVLFIQNIFVVSLGGKILMTSSSQGDKRRNKNFIINNSALLKEYALTNKKNLGTGIIVINLLLIKNDILTKKDIDNRAILSDEERQFSVQSPISYIPVVNFWFKIVRLKIKKKYNIDIKQDYDLENKFLIVFVKDVSLESFSIYSVKLN